MRCENCKHTQPTSRQNPTSNEEVRQIMGCSVYREWTHNREPPCARRMELTGGNLTKGETEVTVDPVKGRERHGDDYTLGVRVLG